MPTDDTRHFSDANFDTEVLQATQPVLVDFWAAWCGPCQWMEPAVDALAAEFRGRALVGKVNVDESPVVSGLYGIRTIPTFLIFKAGKVVETLVGSISARELRARLERHIDATAA